MAFKLPRLPVNWREQPQLFERYWDEFSNKLEKTLNAILDIPIIQQALASINQAVLDAQAAADAAQQAAFDASQQATGAQSQTDDQAKESSLVNSGTTGFTAPLLTATTTGAVTIKSHTRTYGDSILNPPKTVNGATIATGAAANSTVRVYYVDAARAGGAVTYQFTVDPAPAPIQRGDTHSVGAVMIPATGTGNGKAVRTPGYVDLQ
jgi:hypothetical protein